MVDRLAAGELTVSELAAPFSISLPAVSKHIKVLERSGLLQRRVDGRVHSCRLLPESLRLAQEWIDHYRMFWDQQLASLGDFLEVDS